jgi:hypothetical protein
VATGGDIQVTGVREAARDLERLGVRVEDLRAAFGRISSEALPVYRGFTPVRTGRLRGDYRPARTKNRAVLYVGRTSVPYAGPINYGWAARNIEPANFVARGDEVMGPRAVDAIEAELNYLITTV